MAPAANSNKKLKPRGEFLPIPEAPSILMVNGGFMAKSVVNPP